MTVFLDALQERVLLAEGAMGTRLFTKRVAPGTCLEALNLSRPALIREIHEEYRHAGAEVFKSNTFGANPMRLAHHQLEAQCREINAAAVRIARTVAGKTRWVAGVVGPVGERKADSQLREAFSIQVDALAEAGADLILLETFQNLEELRVAIQAAREACDLPLVAQVSPDEKAKLKDGTDPEHYVPKLEQWGAVAIGCNCGAGLAGMLDTVRRLARLTNRPLTAQPSAGLPLVQEGRTVYPCSPGGMAEAAVQWMESGVRLLGGCCGTTPEHIDALRRRIQRSTRAELTR